MTPRTHLAWAILWREQSKLDGMVEQLVGKPNGTTRTELFPTRAAARAHCKEHYGYIADRPDLRAAPFGWRMPRVVPVSITITML